MIEKSCETCEQRALCSVAPRQRCGDGLPGWIARRSALEAEVARLEGVSENLRCVIRAEQADADMSGLAAARGLHIEERLAWTVRRVCAQRDEARAEVAELRKEKEPRR